MTFHLCRRNFSSLISSANSSVWFCIMQILTILINFFFFKVKKVKKNYAEYLQYCINQCHSFLLRGTQDNPYPHFGFTLHFFSFLCKSLSKTDLSSFWNKPIMNLHEKCIFSCLKKSTKGCKEHSALCSYLPFKANTRRGK